MADSTSNTLLSLLSRKPAARPTTPEEEMELLNQQASILASLKEEKPTTTSDLISQAIAGALPLIGGALAGDRLGLAAGASAGAGAIETYRKRMEEEQERQKTTSLLELANVQNRLDAAALAKQEQAKAEASLEKAKASTMLGQIKEAGGSPQEYLNYVRGQSQKASNLLSPEEATYINSALKQAGSPVVFEAGVPKDLAMQALRNPEPFKKAAPATEEEKTSARIMLQQKKPFIEDKDLYGKLEEQLGDPNMTLGQLDKFTDNIKLIGQSTDQATRALKGQSEREERTKLISGNAGIMPLDKIVEKASPNISQEDLISFTPVVDKKKAAEIAENQTNYGSLQGSIQNMKDFLDSQGGRLPTVMGPAAAKFEQLRSDLVNKIRLKYGMGANFTKFEQDNSFAQMLGLTLGEGGKVWNYNLELANQFNTNPKALFNDFANKLEDDYARETINNKYIDTSIRYRPQVLKSAGRLPKEAKLELLMQNNPKLQELIEKKDPTTLKMLKEFIGQ
jgi:hypothetical protein